MPTDANYGPKPEVGGELPPDVLNEIRFGVSDPKGTAPDQPISIHLRPSTPETGVDDFRVGLQESREERLQRMNPEGQQTS